MALRGLRMEQPAHTHFLSIVLVTVVNRGDGPWQDRKQLQEENTHLFPRDGSDWWKQVKHTAEKALQRVSDHMLLGRGKLPPRDP